MRKRKVLLLSLVTIVILSVVVVLMPTFFGRQVSNLLKVKINETINANVTFSEADVNLWRHFPHITVTLEDFVLSGKNEFRYDTLVSMKELHVVLGTIKLLFKNEVDLRELNLYTPDIHIIKLANGKANYDILRGSDSTSTSSEGDVRIEIESCEIKNAAFVYDDRETGILLRSEGLNLDGDADILEKVYELDIKADIEKFSSMYKNKTYINNKKISFDLQAIYDISSGEFIFKDNEININHLNLGLEGKYSFTDNKHLMDVRFHAEDADFKDMLSLSDNFFSDNFNGIDIEGHANFSGFVKGILDTERNITPSFKVNLQVSEGFIKYNKLPSSISNIHFDLVAENNDTTLDRTILNIGTIKMNLGDNPVNGSLQINGFKNGHLKSDIVASLNLEDLEKVYPIEGVLMKGNVQLDLKADGHFDSFDLSPNAKGIRIPGFNMSLNIKDGTFKYDHLPEAFSNIHFDLKCKNTTGLLEHTSLRIEKLQAKLGDNPIQGFIHIDNLKDPTIDADLKANINLAEVKDFYPIDDLLLKGIFDLDMRVSGQHIDSLDKFPLVDAKVNIKDAFIKSNHYPVPMENMHLVLEALNTTGNVKDTRINIDTLTYMVENESFFVRGAVTDLENYSYNLAVKGMIYLDKIHKILNLQDKVKMSGQVDMNFKTAGTYTDLIAKRYHRLPTSGQVLMKDIYLESKELPHGLNIDAGHFYFSNEKIFLDTLHGSFGRSSFNLTGHVYNYFAYLLHNDESVKGDRLLTSDTLSLNELLSETKTKVADTTHHNLSVIKIPENVTFTFDTRINHLIYKDLAVNDLIGDITIDNGILSVKQTSFNALDAGFRISADYDTRNINRPLFDLNLKIDELDINKAHDAFVTVQVIAPAAEDTYGIFSVDYQLKGELLPNLYPHFESIEGSGTVRIREAKVNGMKVFHHISGITKKEELKNPQLKDIVMETQVEKGIIYVKPFSMKLAGFDTDIEGKHNMDGTMNYIIRMAIPPFDIVKIPLHVNGTYENPRIHLGKGHEETFKKITSINRFE